MAHDVKAADPLRFPDGKPKIISPVRFTRYRGAGIAGIGTHEPRDHAVESGAPPVDDHGHLAFAASSARGASVSFGAQAGAANRFTVQPVRDFLGPDAKLFAVVDDPSVVTVVDPPGGGPLPRVHPNIHGGVGKIDYVVDDDRVVLASSVPPTQDSRTTALRLHYGTPEGPIVAELAVTVFRAIQVPVKFHAVTINALDTNGQAVRGRSPATTPAEVAALARQIREVFAQVNAIYEQAGIAFALAETDRAGNPVIHQVSNDGPLVAGYQHADCLTDERENFHVLTLGTDPQVLNAFIIRNFCGREGDRHQQNGRVGYGVSRSKAEQIRRGQAPGAPSTQPGIIFLAPGQRRGQDPNVELLRALDRVLTHTIAHELGHCLELDHYDGGEEGNHGVRNDLWAHSNLMHNFANLNSSADPRPVGNDPRFYNSSLRADAGYGISRFPAAVGIGNAEIHHTGQALCARDRRSARAGTQVATGLPSPENQLARARMAAANGSFRWF